MKLKYKKMSFSIPILNWKLYGTFGARIKKCLFSFHFNNENRMALSVHRVRVYFVRSIFNCIFWLKINFSPILNSIYYLIL